MREVQATRSTVTAVASSPQSVMLAAKNSLRQSLYIYNDSTSVLYVKLGEVASSSLFTVKMDPGDFLEFPYPCYIGRVDGVWVTGNGNAMITELW
jgi:hypothetical protein